MTTATQQQMMAELHRCDTAMKHRPIDALGWTIALTLVAGVIVLGPALLRETLPAYVLFSYAVGGVAWAATRLVMRAKYKARFDEAEYRLRAVEAQQRQFRH